MLSMVIFLLLSVLHCFETLAADPQSWRSRSIYQLVTDRFALSDFGADAPYNMHCDPSARQYCGGTWRGIIDHLDYIQGMGFDAIWISPPFANVEGLTPFGEAYHGYWPQDLGSLNAHFGTVNDLKELSMSLHSRGMFLMLDIVVNHMLPQNPVNSTAFRLAKAANAKATTDTIPFSNAADFHDVCWITDYSNQTEVEQCWLGNEAMPWADVDTENPDVVGTLNSWISDIVSVFDVDGLRLSTVKHISRDFWQGFTSEAVIFTIGEVFSNDINYVGPYTQVMNAVLDYPTWFKLVSAFASPRGNLSNVVQAVLDSQASYRSGTFMTGSFLENHDQPRFGSFTNDAALVVNAIVWPFIHDGIPILYYGQEQGFSGGGVPSNQEALWQTGYNTSHPYYSLVTSLNLARKAAIRSGDYFLTTPMRFIHTAHESTLAVSKPPLLTLFTNSGSSSQSSVSWNTTQRIFKGGEQLVDALTCRTYWATDNGGIDLVSNDGMPRILMPVTVLRGSSRLCSWISRNESRRVGLSASWATILAPWLIALMFTSM